jgi:uncharacterized membrane protein YfcA
MAALAQSAVDRRAIAWREIRPLLPFTLIGVITALYLFHAVDKALLIKLLGLFVVGFAFYSLRGVRPHPRDKSWSAPAGLLGGLVGTLFGTGGPFYVIYLRVRQLDKRAFRATTAMIFLIDGGLRLLGFAGTGLLGWEGLVLVLMALPFKMLGLWAGHRIQHRLNERHFFRFVSLVLLASGLALLLKEV